MFTEAEHRIVRRLAPVVSSLRLTARRSVAPADGQTSAGIEITANGIEWGSQVVGGRALQLAESDGVDLVSSTPGRFVVEISGPELWPLAFDLEYQPTGSMTLSWERESFIANGQDLVRLNISLVGDGVNGEAIVQILSSPMTVSRRLCIRLGSLLELFVHPWTSIGTRSQFEKDTRRGF